MSQKKQTTSRAAPTSVSASDTPQHDESAGQGLHVERGWLPCWTTTRTRRGRLVGRSDFDPPPDWLASGVAGERLALMLVQTIRQSAAGGSWRDVPMTLRTELLKTMAEAGATVRATSGTDRGWRTKGAAAHGFLWTITMLAISAAAGPSGERVAAAWLADAERRRDAELARQAQRRREFVQRMAAARARSRRAARGRDDGAAS
jgi:hypothetical protein